MSSFPEGNALVYCEGAFGTPYGKTAHGLVRRTRRYRVLSIIDSRHAGSDAGQVLDGQTRGILIHKDLPSAVEIASKSEHPATHFVYGVAPDGGRLTPEHRTAVIQAVQAGLNVDSGLHEFLTEDQEISDLAVKHHVCLRDVRKTPPRNALHFFSGKIEQVTSLKVAVLGTDSAVGKRTTAWLLVDALQAAGFSAELIGTGQTAWMQGIRYSIMLDSLVNDFVSGEIEHAIWSAWNDLHPDAIVIEGQGSLMNPAYPGGFEILAAGRPAAVVLQHAPSRKDYDGFPGYSIQPLDVQIKAIELLSGKPVVAVVASQENLSRKELDSAIQTIEKQTRLPAIDVLTHGAGRVVEALLPYLKKVSG